MYPSFIIQSMSFCLDLPLPLHSSLYGIVGEMHLNKPLSPKYYMWPPVEAECVVDDQDFACIGEPRRKEEEGRMV